MRLKPLLFLSLSLLMSACTRSAGSSAAWTPVAPQPIAVAAVSPIQTYLPPTRAPGSPLLTPTPNPGRGILPTAPAAAPSADESGPDTYTVQAGDYLGAIADSYGITLEELAAANNLDPNAAVIYPGDTLIIPGKSGAAAAPVSGGGLNAEYFKIIPDSELVYGPLATLLNIEQFIQQKGGYLSYYTQEVDGETLSGAQILRRVAEEYSVNPRLLLAALEYRSQWVSNPNPAPSTLYTPIGYVDDYRVGLYRQLAWTADRLNEGFYRWREGKISRWQLADGTVLTPQPGINPGTAGVQNLFAALDDPATWQLDCGPNGLYATYNALFGYPFDFAIEPLLPAGLTPPALILPFAKGEIWAFSGGPHGGWDSGSAWAALDFAPPGDPIGCAPSEAWTTAVANGTIISAENGRVVQDLDNDGLEQTGWTILYMHMESRDRVQPGAFVRAGERIGHPSCEGGVADADHLHLARRYNGMWISATEPGLIFTLDGWQISGGDKEYDGFLTRNGQSVEAWGIVTPLNQIQR
ncbi:MAG: hypothetical protein OHK0031_11150 [Anaerolineales bacterium]